VSIIAWLIVGVPSVWGAVLFVGYAGEAFRKEV